MSDAPSRRAVSAFAFSLFGRLLRATGRLLVFLCVARLYGLEASGRFAFVLAGGTLAAVASNFGFPEFLMREIPTRGAISPAILARALSGCGFSH